MRGWRSGSTSPETGWRSGRCSGADGIRTRDLRAASASLSQLSYGPRTTQCSRELKRNCPVHTRSLVVPGWAESKKDLRPAFEKLDPSFRFVRLPSNPILEQLYQRKKIDKGVYPWAGEVETFAVPSAIMTRDRRDSEYVTLIQRLLLTILSNKDKLDATGHPKWKGAQFRFMIPSVAYPPSNDVILIYNILDAYGYGMIKK